ncbi:hypothetical protein GCM10022226_61190 [Sphaerisporangium flaviroseum]|uniref:Uncharacterized protein n=1 Tax=Sphaerisporangium flaviroseum TaxID=509199 RepID=A0ABP7J0Q3_9ACTN
MGVAVDPTHIASNDPAVLALVRADRRALRTIRDEPDLAVRYVNTLIASLSEAEARLHYERYVAPYFTADGRILLTCGPEARCQSRLDRPVARSARRFAISRLIAPVK